MKKTSMLLVCILMVLLMASQPFTSSANIGLAYPTSSRSVTQRYSSGHKAIDYSAAEWTRVTASAAGTVSSVYSGCNNKNAAASGGKSCSTATCSPSTGNFLKVNYDGYSRYYCNYSAGNSVTISHDNGIYTKYLHLIASSVAVGQTVSLGTLIGYVGSTGRSTGNHLHFSLCVGGSSSDDGIDPQPWLNQGPGAVTISSPIASTAHLELTETSVYLRAYLTGNWSSYLDPNRPSRHVVKLGVPLTLNPVTSSYEEYLPTVKTLSQFGNRYLNLVPGTPYQYNMRIWLSDGSVYTSSTMSFTTPGSPPVTMVSSITLSPNSLSITPGQTSALAATILPDGATNKALTWSSNNPDVATIGSNGVTGVSPGTAIITATAQDGSGVSGICTVTVSSIAVSSVILNRTSAEMFPDDNLALSATVLPENATNPAITWISHNPGVASVSNSGIVTAISPGIAVINARTFEGINRATCSIHVKPILVSSISLDPANFDLVLGRSAVISANVLPVNATGKGIVWSSSNPDIAAVDQNGQVTGVVPGTTVITATAQDGSNVSGSMTVKVSMPTPVISSLGANGMTATLKWGADTGAQSYYVYRSVNGGAFAFLKGTTGTTISDSGLVVGNSYTYRVQANGPGGSKSEMSAVRSVTLKLAAPVISSLSVSGTTATLCWGAVAGAESYYVYRSVNGGAFAFLKGTTGAQINDTGLAGGNWVSYRVRANASSGAVTAMSSAKGITVLAAPVIRSLGASGTTATLTWGAVSGAASYYVYRSVNGGAYAFLKGTTGITVNDPGLTIGSSYYYKVQANGSGGNESALSALKGIKIDINLAAPVINSLNVSGTTAALSWGKVTYAESYYVYRSVNGGAFAFLKGTTGTTVNDSGLAGGNSYAYQVQANGPGGTKSAQSSVKSVTLKLATPVISSLSTNGTTTATLIWGAVSGAESYYVYRSVNGGVFDFLKGTTGTTIKDPGLVAGNSYAYHVQANGPGGTKSEMSTVRSFALK